MTPTTQNYGERGRWGPYHRQAVRWLGRAFERLGQRLDEWSWAWGEEIGDYLPVVGAEPDRDDGDAMAHA